METAGFHCRQESGSLNQLALLLLYSGSGLATNLVARPEPDPNKYGTGHLACHSDPANFLTGHTEFNSENQEIIRLTAANICI